MVVQISFKTLQMMANRRHRILPRIAILAVLLLIGLWIQVAIKSNQRPSYNGKTVDQWFYGDLGHRGRAETMKKASIAFNAIGTNCMHYLIEKARGNETALNRWYCKLYPDLPVSLKQWIKPGIPAAYDQMLAVSYFSDLERNDRQILDPFMSQLMDIVPIITNNNTRYAAFSLVEGSLSRARDKAQTINFFLSFSSDPSFWIRLRAMILLSEVDHTITNGIPVLTQAITNRALVSSAISGMNAQYRRQKFEMVVNDHQRQAYESLARIDPDKAEEYEIDE